MHVDMDDVNYSVLTYAASEKKNAMGPSLLDPRSGEILEGGYHVVGTTCFLGT